VPSQAEGGSPPPIPGEPRTYIETLFDTVDRTSLAKRALSGDGAPITLAAGEVGRLGNSVAFAQRVPRKVRSDPVAEAPNAPDPFVPKHDRQWDSQVAVVEMNVRSTHAR
jgi:hypothetical protein